MLNDPTAPPLPQTTVRQPPAQAKLAARFRELCAAELPLPGHGHTAERHRRLFAVSRESVSLAKLAEAHWDALAILAEAGRTPVPHALYAVWASEIPGQALNLTAHGNGYRLHGAKQFCSGATLVDRALITVGSPESLLVDVDLRRNAEQYDVDLSPWVTEAFRHTATGTVTFRGVTLDACDVLGPPDWYVDRPGFWHGACGPAACWAGGAAGLVDFARASRRSDPHTLAHLAAMEANLWALTAYLDEAGRQIDAQAQADPENGTAAQVRALTVRHMVEQACTDTLHRFARAYGPYPLAMHHDTAIRYAETDLFLRQAHGERDLEGLARLLRGSVPQA